MAKKSLLHFGNCVKKVTLWLKCNTVANRPQWRKCHSMAKKSHCGGEATVCFSGYISASNKATMTITMIVAASRTTRSEWW